MALRQADIDYFNRGIVENPRFWSRFGGQPDFADADVADFGCGHGSLCIGIALAGARRVIGFDLDGQRIDFATANLLQNYPQLRDRVEFRQQDVREAPEAGFSYFVSKDTFEHVLELDQILAAMRARLRPGGRIYAGFGPLWNSPWGDHRRTRIGIPWGHVIFSEPYLIRRLNHRNAAAHVRVASIYDLGLNKLAVADYRRLFCDSGLRIVSCRVNASSRPISRLFSLLRAVPLLQEYASHNLYCILEKPGA
jgi:SAM-dependent methyltransferase